MKKTITRTIWKAFSRAAPTMIGVIVLGFALLNMMPGDAADAIAGASGSATAENLAEVRRVLGLDQGFLSRLLSYISGIVRLDLGMSTQFSAPVVDVILERIPNTLLLMLSAFAMSLLVGILLGWVMAAFAGRWPDRLLTSISVVLYSTPGFWLGLMAIVLFAVVFPWFPSGGAETVGSNLQGFAWWKDRMSHLFLPALTLSCFFIAIYARLTRAAMLEVLRQDFMRTAAAKGLHPVVMQFRHGLRNALIPVVTVAGLHLGNLLGGAVVIETVFNWPGLGRLLTSALAARDFNVLLGIFLLSSVSVIVTNTLMDLLVMWLDPRIEI